MMIVNGSQQPPDAVLSGWNNFELPNVGQKNAPTIAAAGPNQQISATAVGTVPPPATGATGASSQVPQTQSESRRVPATSSGPDSTTTTTTAAEVRWQCSSSGSPNNNNHEEVETNGKNNLKRSGNSTKQKPSKGPIKSLFIRSPELQQQNAITKTTSSAKRLQEQNKNKTTNEDWRRLRWGSDAVSESSSEEDDTTDNNINIAHTVVEHQDARNRQSRLSGAALHFYSSHLNGTGDKKKKSKKNAIRGCGGIMSCYIRNNELEKILARQRELLVSAMN